MRAIPRFGHIPPLIIGVASRSIVFFDTILLLLITIGNDLNLISGQQPSADWHFSPSNEEQMANLVHVQQVQLIVDKARECSLNSSSAGNSEPLFRLDFSVPTYHIGCLLGYPPKKTCDGHAQCQQNNTMWLYFCYESVFESKNRKVRPQFYLNNQAGNAVAEVCNSPLLSKGKLTRHGFGLWVCVREWPDEKEHLIETHLQTSFSGKIYVLPNKIVPFITKNDKKHVHQFSLLLGLYDNPLKSTLMPYTRIQDGQGNVFNSDESLSPKGGSLKQAMLTKHMENNALAFTFMDMLAITNGSDMQRKIEIVYSNHNRACAAFGTKTAGKRIKTIRINEIDVDLAKCNMKARDQPCKAQFGTEEVCNQMRDYKRKICDAKWRCWRNEKPPTQELQERRLLPNYIVIRNPSNGFDSLEKEFNRKTKCDRKDNFMLDDAIKLNPKIAEKVLEFWDKECGKSNEEKNKDRRKKKRSNFNSVRGKFDARPKGWEWRWKSPIPYRFDDSMFNNEDDIKLVHSAVALIEQETCISFVNNQSAVEDFDHMLFIKNDHGRCESESGIGREGGEHWIQLDTPFVHVVIHEIGHALGLWHEMTRLDRDSYIWTSGNKISEDYIEMYRAPLEAMYSYGYPYDFGSVMHYETSWKRDGFGSATYADLSIQRIYQHSIGPSFVNSLVFRDTKILNYFYCMDPKFHVSCKKPLLNCKNEGYQDPLNCKRCRCPRGFGGRFCDQLVQNDLKLCKSSLGKFTIDPEGESITQLRGSIMGKGSCFWLIKIVNAKGQAVKLNEVVVKTLSGLTCANTLGVEDCGSDQWIYPCGNHLRIQYQKNKTETGARICCQQELPLTLSKVNDNFEFGEVLLELFVSEFDEKQEEMSFELEFRTGVPEDPKFACDCPSALSLFKEERNPYAQGEEFGRDDNTKPGCDKDGLYAMSAHCSIGDLSGKTVFKINGIDVDKKIYIFRNEVTWRAELLCMNVTGGSDSFWVWRKFAEDASMELIRVDEILCFNETMV